ncbi:MAG: hypothetical protein GH143_11115 [Calditrichaeota bacterium]|nr:hypothetical protein [Calditrichota bacterium]
MVRFYLQVYIHLWGNLDTSSQGYKIIPIAYLPGRDVNPPSVKSEASGGQGQRIEQLGMSQVDPGVFKGDDIGQIQVAVCPEPEIGIALSTRQRWISK